MPTARAVRRWTAQAGNRRGGASLGSLLGDVYYAAVLVAVGIGVALGAANLVQHDAPARRADVPVVLDLPVLVVAAVLALAGALVSLAGRLGPVGLGGAEATWWLGLPVDRRGLLRPPALRLPLVAAGASAAVVAVLDAGFADGAGARLGRVGLAAALAGAGLVLAA
ncbi:DUF6297 family protein, partial [Cellulomonas endophytica]|uniref:DUF6297 family protein n=1 Tax=Cellulomonas endophytica TaxID=2494735 RepID=UPI001F0C2B22